MIFKIKISFARPCDCHNSLHIGQTLFTSNLVLSNLNLVCFFRYLKNLEGSFNEIMTSVIEELKPMADGETLIPIKKYINNFTLTVISKVRY